MQAVIPVRPSDCTPGPDTLICGIPLLERVILTAVRSGCTEVLLICPPSTPAAGLRPLLNALKLERVPVDTVEFVVPFDEADAGQWRSLSPYLQDTFLWIPWGYIPYRHPLSEMIARAAARPLASVRFACPDVDAATLLERPIVLAKASLTGADSDRLECVLCDSKPGFLLQSPASTCDAERALVRHSGKASDGLFSRFNRKLCWPAVRGLSHTRITPNAVSFAGLAVAIFSGLLFASGGWLNEVAGALVFFVSGLFDEIDGMLARLKFEESAFGTWLETMIDYTTYLIIFAGMTVAGYRRHGAEYLVLGIALVAGSILSFWVISIQRRLAAPAGRPGDYSPRYLKALENDNRNPISSSVRLLQFLTRKGVLMHYLVAFAIVGLLPVFFVLSSLGANIAWMVTIYLNARLFSGNARVASPTHTEVPLGVKQ
ncbi:MAG: CDP-alcohol phosphatidyltransferase family protein [Bryobacteraceae bacterium]|nr:CDP-alcohol phosphatidyltransferase family protein [Bryobacteraceae bacterium]